MASILKNLIDSKDYNGLEQALSQNPGLANEGIAYDDINNTRAHPLHRICDGVFTGKYPDEDAVKMARILLDHGADINGGQLIKKQDTPLIAAASLYADKVAIFYIKQGADIFHPGTHGGTALHWAAWCGRDQVVDKLIQAGAEVNKRCIDFNATPLFWAVRALKHGDKGLVQNQADCITLLLQAGADKTIPNKEGKTVFNLLINEDAELKELLS